MELSDNEQLGELPLPGSRYLANGCFQVRHGKQAAQEKQERRTSAAFARALSHPSLGMFGQQRSFLLLPALDIYW